MKTEVILLAKNHYDMEGNRGASVLLYGDYEDTNNKTGISITNADIDYEEHHKLNTFPAKYSCDFVFVTKKNRSGKDITGLKFTNLELVEKLKFVVDK